MAFVSIGLTLELLMKLSFKYIFKLLCLGLPFFLGCKSQTQLATINPSVCKISFTVLGTGQDGGAPQIGNHNDRAWTDPSAKLTAASGAVVNHETERYYLFEATPDIREQLYLLDETINAIDKPHTLSLSGVFITHAHIGHYAGLMMFGHEAAGRKNLPVYVMPRMASFLENNGPWSQLVDFQNINLKRLEDKQTMPVEDSITVTPYRVPHRDEFSETVGFVVETKEKSLLFLPDIDDWDEWEADFNISIEAMISKVDYAYLDATFFDDNELPGRDMSLIPHPRMFGSAQRFSTLSATDKQKVRFFHMNHTNPARYPSSPQSQQIESMGFHIAKQGESICLEAQQ